jgi:hypothetical protein
MRRVQIREMPTGRSEYCGLNLRNLTIIKSIISIWHDICFLSKRLRITARKFGKAGTAFIKEGGATNFNDLITVALQRYLETYNTEFMEQE